MKLRNSKKIDRRKKYFIVLDVETANALKKGYPNDCLVYDLGFAVYDKQGNEYEAKSFVITDIFDDMKDLMKTAHYNKKLPKYFEDLKKGTRQRVTIFQARRILHQIMKKYNITKVYAYNACFDLTSLNNTVRYISKSLCRYFFPYGTQICDIWHIACQVLGTQKTFQWENIRKKETNNLITSAERMFGYISQTDFKEEHTGLEDTRIEAQILVRCFKSHKSFKENIYSACWRIPQKVAV